MVSIYIKNIEPVAVFFTCKVHAGACILVKTMKVCFVLTHNFTCIQCYTGV